MQYDPLHMNLLLPFNYVQLQKCCSAKWRIQQEKASYGQTVWRVKNVTKWPGDRIFVQMTASRLFATICLVSGSFISHQRALRNLCMARGNHFRQIKPGNAVGREHFPGPAALNCWRAYTTTALKGSAAFQCKTTDTMAAIYFSDRTIYGAITINHCRGKEDYLTHPEPP